MAPWSTKRRTSSQYSGSDCVTRYVREREPQPNLTMDLLNSPRGCHGAATGLKSVIFGTEVHSTLQGSYTFSSAVGSAACQSSEPRHTCRVSRGNELLYSRAALTTYSNCVLRDKLAMLAKTCTRQVAWLLSGLTLVVYVSAQSGLPSALIGPASATTADLANDPGGIFHLQACFALL